MSFLTSRRTLVALFALWGSSSAYLSHVSTRRTSMSIVQRKHTDGTTFMPGTQLHSALDDFDDNEETLMKLHLSINQDVSTDDAVEIIRQYTQSFPFSAILPVQPLQYLPTHDGGVDVLFLRKKTQEKGSVDGGIRFFVTSQNDSGDIEVTAKRNSQGQVISKAFSEKQIIQKFVKGMSGEEPLQGQLDPTEVTSVESIYYKWMD